MERLISKDTELKIILVICGIIWVGVFVKMILDMAEGISSIALVGGAVVDILEGRKPKDYECVGTMYEYMLGLVLSHESKTAKTFKKGCHMGTILRDYRRNSK
jgi:hypothetical protein